MKPYRFVCRLNGKGGLSEKDMCSNDHAFQGKNVYPIIVNFIGTELNI